MASQALTGTSASQSLTASNETAGTCMAAWRNTLETLRAELEAETPLRQLSNLVRDPVPEEVPPSNSLVLEGMREEAPPSSNLVLEELREEPDETKDGKDGVQEALQPPLGAGPCWGFALGTCTTTSKPRVTKRHPKQKGNVLEVARTRISARLGVRKFVEEVSEIYTLSGTPIPVPPASSTPDICDILREHMRLPVSCMELVPLARQQPCAHQVAHAPMKFAQLADACDALEFHDEVDDFGRRRCAACLDLKYHCKELETEDGT